MARHENMKSVDFRAYRSKREHAEVTRKQLADDTAAFLESLTGAAAAARDLPLGRPEAVPSALLVD